MQLDKVGTDKIVGDGVLGHKFDVAGNAIIRQRVSGKDAARNQQIRQHLLVQLQATWLEGVLENNINQVARLELALERVDEPGERPNQQARELPPTSKILDTFRAFRGAMLILGEPGSGKTITLLELARELQQVALKDERQPVPLVFNLSSWTQERPSLIDWLVEELFLVYGVGRKYARTWLDTMPYHLLLDGLDEVAAEHREDCVAVINEFREEYGPVNVVVCSRTDEYEGLTNRLQLMGAAVIQPLNETQINTFLSAAGPHPTQLVNSDPALKELAQTPLNLTMIALTYRDHTKDERPIGRTQQSHRLLFSTYVNRMFERRGGANEVDKPQSIRYLAWLATRMQEYNESIYYIEKTQPSWLGWRKWLYSIVSILLFGLSYTLYLGLSFWLFILLSSELSGGLLDMLKFGLFFGLIGGMISGLTRIKLAETLVWSWRKWLSVVLLYGLIGVLLVVEGIKISRVLEMLGAMLSGILVLALFYGLDKKVLQFKSTPNVGIRLPGRDSLKIGLIVGLSFGLGSLISVGLNKGLGFGLSGGVMFGLFFGLVGGLRCGGSAYIKHYLLRWFLARYNYLPFNLVPFLDDMAGRHILHKVGGGYIFNHRLLLEYFASLETVS